MADRYKKITERYRDYRTQFQPVIQSKKGKAYFMLILSFFTMAFFGLFALWPTLRIIATLQKEISDSQFVDDRLTKKIIALSQAQANYELIRGAIPSLNRSLPTSPEIGQVLSSVESIARTTNATISAFRMEKILLSTSSAARSGEDRSQPTSIPFTLTINGGYEQLLTFIKLLISNPRITRIDSLSIQPSSDKLGLVTITVDAQSKSFYYR